MADTAAQRQKRYRAKNLVKVRKSEWRSKIKRLYNLTIEEYEEMLKSQKRKCFLCGKALRKGDVNIDHDHMTNQVRKLLCTYCNIRMASVDNEEWLSKAIQYRDTYRKEGRLP